MVKIYTKTGDGGETSLFNGTRLPKDALRIEAYGTIDELNSIIGLCRSLNTVREVDACLAEIQNDLFVCGADLATPQGPKDKKIDRLPASAIHRLEKEIDKIDPKLEPLKHFILPGGTRTAALLHVARTICRRAERLVMRLSRSESINTDILVYLNRLSDFLFVLARQVNSLSNTPEVIWSPQREH